MPDSDSTPEDSPPTSLPDEQAAAILSAKPLPPRPRPAFTRKTNPEPPEPRQTTEIDLSEIPEAVPLDSIPEGIPLDQDSSTVLSPARPAMAKPPMRTPGNRPIRPKNTPQSPQNRVAPQDDEPEVEEPERVPLDKSRIADFETYESGGSTVRPLDKAPGVESRQVQRLEKPKFLDGELPRRVERGVQYPLPGRVLITSVFLLLFKLSLFGTIVGLTTAMIVDQESLIYVIWLPASLIVFGILFVMSAHRTRCRICSCHMFYNRRCFKHQKAHRLWGLGYGGSAALHGILFKWLRCMYCGTAIRLRPPKPDSDEAEVNRPAESQQADYDKSLIKPRAPK